jgi:hypothetical protein
MSSSTSHCGCVEGFAGLVIGVALFARHYLTMAGGGPGWRTVLTAIGWALAGAVTGKVIGLTWPRLLPSARAVRRVSGSRRS